MLGARDIILGRGKEAHMSPVVSHAQVGLIIMFSTYAFFRVEHYSQHFDASILALQQ